MKITYKTFVWKSEGSK